MTDRLRAGVVGVGTMGENHARVYGELSDATLAGVHDADGSRARSVADAYDTTTRSLEDLLATVDVVSVAVPTEYHFETVKTCLEAGVDVLVEKPFVAEPAEGRRLIDLAEQRGRTLQVGHVERFNPATRRLLEVVDDLDVIAVSARRLGPPLDREIDDSVVMDLMIHDVDVLTSLVDDDVADLNAVGTADGEYAAANVEFDSGVVGQLTASRVTQQKIRELTVSAADCRVTVDYIDQTVRVHRQSLPEYVTQDGDLRHRHERVVEQLSVERREPLKNELESFLAASRGERAPTVDGEDGLRALRLTRTIEDMATAPGGRTPSDPIVQ